MTTTAFAAVDMKIFNCFNSIWCRGCVVRDVLQLMQHSSLHNQLQGPSSHAEHRAILLDQFAQFL